MENVGVGLVGLDPMLQQRLDDAVVLLARRAHPLGVFVRADQVNLEQLVVVERQVTVFASERKEKRFIVPRKTYHTLIVSYFHLVTKCKIKSKALSPWLESLFSDCVDDY